MKKIELNTSKILGYTKEVQKSDGKSVPSMKVGNEKVGLEKPDDME
ncbi:MAG: hypothetical protein AAGF28_12395 [Pseudomonadota bacterium]